MAMCYYETAAEKAAREYKEPEQKRCVGWTAMIMIKFFKELRQWWDDLRCPHLLDLTRKQVSPGDYIVPCDRCGKLVWAPSKKIMRKRYVSWNRTR